MNFSHKAARTMVCWPFCLVFIIVLSAQAFAQTTPVAPSAQPQPTPRPTTEKNFFSNILRDQKGIWTAPFHVHQSDAKWIAPLLLSTGALVVTDRHTSGTLVAHGDNLNRLRISKDISYLGSAYATGGTAALFYIAGRLKHDERAKETGLLAAEAFLDSAIVAQALKVASQRQRPPVDNSSGEFFDGGSSFPSGHAISAWSVATVIGEEYGPRHPAVRYGAYALATAVGISRYTGRKHFLSDVLVGSAMGYGIGRYVYHQHHDLSLDLLNEKKTSRVPWKLIPRVSPLYGPRSHVYGALLAWNF
ncbi:MAG TPA: phosphatase PAP2 family protein [Pyrinomonadaceae bacterium]|nr:phosphatase PAP2 family protein [Pyrinomonadaceae bacterium]